jgi:hypothetical protein
MYRPNKSENLLLFGLEVQIAGGDLRKTARKVKSWSGENHRRSRMILLEETRFCSHVASQDGFAVCVVLMRY